MPLHHPTRVSRAPHGRRLGQIGGFVAPVGGAAAFSPDDLAGLAYWFQADTIAQADGSAVATWPDDSVGAQDATQATAANRPTYKTNIVGGHAVVRFDGSNDFLSSAASASEAAFTVLAVVKLAGHAVAGTIIGAEGGGAGGGGIQWFVNTSGVPALNAQGVSGLGVADTALGTAAFHVIAVTYSDAGNSCSFVLDGVADGTDATADSITAARTTCIGSWDAAGQALQGDVAEIIKYDSVLTTDNLNAAGEYLAAKYGLTWTGL